MLQTRRSVGGSPGAPWYATDVARSARETERLIELSLSAPDRATFQLEALTLLNHRIGFDCAFFAAAGGSAPGGRHSCVLAGLDRAYLDRLEQHGTEFAPELVPVKQYADTHGGVAVDSLVLGHRVQDTSYYQCLVRPRGGGHSLLCFLERAGQPLGMVMLGRGTRNPFRDRDLARMRSLRSVLSLAMAAYGGVGQGREPDEDGVAFTPRERELVAYVRLGHSNHDIALALGTSPNTVRNQLSALYRKLGVATRAELVGRCSAQ